MDSDIIPSVLNGGILGGLPLDAASGGAPAGPAPMQPGPAANPPDMSAIVAQLIPRIVQGSQQVQQTASQIPTDNVPMPPRGFGYNPQFQPVTGQGFGGGVKNLLGDILKGAALIGSSTRPGQAIEKAYYGPGVNQYEAQRQQRASQVESVKSKGALQASATGELSQAAGAASLAGYRGSMVGIRQEDSDTKRKNADTNATKVANQAAQAIVKEQQGWAKLTQQEQFNKFKEWFGQNQIAVERERIQAGEDMNTARIESQANLASALAQNNFVKSNPLIGEFLMNVLGEPTFQQSPGAQTTPVTKPNTKGGTRGAQGAVVPKGQIVYDPQGVPHTSDGTRPLPQGWSLKPKGRK